MKYEIGFEEKKKYTWKKADSTKHPEENVLVDKTRAREAYGYSAPDSERTIHQFPKQCVGSLNTIKLH